MAYGTYPGRRVGSRQDVRVGCSAAGGWPVGESVEVPTLGSVELDAVSLVAFKLSRLFLLTLIQRPQFFARCGDDRRRPLVEDDMVGFLKAPIPANQPPAGRVQIPGHGNKELAPSGFLSRWMIAAGSTGS